MISNFIPRVLYRPNGNSLAIERVLKTAHELILSMPDGANQMEEDKINTCLDDLEVILKNLY